MKAQPTLDNMIIQSNCFPYFKIIPSKSSAVCFIVAPCYGRGLIVSVLLAPEDDRTVFWVLPTQNRFAQSIITSLSSPTEGDLVRGVAMTDGY